MERRPADCRCPPNGVTERQFVVSNPDFFTNVPPLSTLTAQLAPLNVWQVDGHLRAPYTMQTAIGV